MNAENWSSTEYCDLYLKNKIQSAVESINILENSIVTGKITEAVNSELDKNILSPDFISIYSLFEERKEACDHVFRKYWVDEFIRSFCFLGQEPIKVFKATSESCNLTNIVLAKQSYKKLTLRSDQYFSSRMWRLGFRFHEPEQNKKYADYIFNRGLKKLGGDITGLRPIQATFLSGRSKLELDSNYKFDVFGKKFERLICDILNEHQPFARFARIDEDILEKTDLRIKYPFLRRKRGARIQVSIVSDEEHHTSKVNSIKHSREFVIVTPFDIANFLFKQEDLHVMVNFSKKDFLKIVKVYDDDVQILARRLSNIFYAAINLDKFHPMGPMYFVPRMLRELICVYVAYHSALSTNELRKREDRFGQWKGSSRKYMTHWWMKSIKERLNKT